MILIKLLAFEINNCLTWPDSFTVLSFINSNKNYMDQGKDVFKPV